MIIYKITNTINGKIYIGQTIKTLGERKKGYRKEIYNYENRIRPSRPIVHAMSKYGIENFQFEILHQDVSSQEELDNLEIYEIEKK